MFTGLGSLMNHLLEPQRPQHEIVGNIIENMVRAETYARSDSPTIASAGREWLSQLTAQLMEHGIQVHGSSSTLDEANP
jgi:hypothetical protein